MKDEKLMDEKRGLIKGSKSYTMNKRFYLIDGMVTSEQLVELVNHSASSVNLHLSNQYHYRRSLAIIMIRIRMKCV